MLSEGDLYLVESLAVSVADLRDCTRMVNAEGLVRMNVQGNLVPHAGMGLKKQLEGQLNMAAMALGLNPRARQQLMIAGRVEDVGEATKLEQNTRAF
jgi:P27 family predicted phage terminase small subunit